MKIDNGDDHHHGILVMRVKRFKSEQFWLLWKDQCMLSTVLSCSKTSLEVGSIVCLV